MRHLTLVGDASVLAHSTRRWIESEAKYVPIEIVPTRRADVGTVLPGVDPTTLDMMNQQEQPASNVGAQIFESLLERDQSLKLVPALAAEMPKLIAPTTWLAAPLGARFAHAVSQRTLRRGFAFFLALVSLRMLLDPR